MNSRETSGLARLLKCYTAAYNIIMISPSDPGELLKMKKISMGLHPDKLVFIGSSNVANYHWCPMKSIISNLYEEPSFFSSCLLDGIAYSLYLEKVKEPTKAPELDRLLAMKVELQLEDMERILEQVGPELMNELCKKRGGMLKGIMGDWYRDHFGELLRRKVEFYPAIRCHFSWRDYIVTVTPHGITDRFVYKFDVMESELIYHTYRDVILTLTDIYGYFLERPRKMHQTYIKDEDKIKTVEEAVNRERAEEVLKEFDRAYHTSKREAHTLMEWNWKCEMCNYKQRCESLRSRIGLI